MLDVGARKDDRLSADLQVGETKPLRMEFFNHMKTTLHTASPSQLETECLVVPVLDAAENNNGDQSDKHDPRIQTSDKAVIAAAADLIASGEVTGKMLETTLLHKPAGLKAKRLLLIGGGKAKNFSSSELRKLAGAAVRNLKAKDLKSFAFVAPGAGAEENAEGDRRRRACRQLRSRLLQERPQGAEDRRAGHRRSAGSEPEIAEDCDGAGPHHRRGAELYA